MNSVTLICQGCGRPFTLAQSDYDRMLDENIQTPRFCSIQCALHGWDPAAVWYGRYRRSQNDQKG
ncbi:MAG: hypothetical protein PUG04_00475 [Lachnospiraceae bacterium]|nr:hypothetical protein [Lachnospiraceae bacterium]